MNGYCGQENTRFLSKLRKAGLGTGEMEAIIHQQLKGKKVLGNYKRRDELLGVLFREKIDDAKVWEGERRKKRNMLRKKVEESLGAKSRKYKNLIKELRRKMKNIEKIKQNNMRLKSNGWIESSGKEQKIRRRLSFPGGWKGTGTARSSPQPAKWLEKQPKVQ